MRINKKDFFDIAVQLAIKKGFISEEITIDYELSGKIDNYFQLVSIEKVLLARIQINEIYLFYGQPKFIKSKLIKVKNKPKEYSLNWKRKIFKKYLYIFFYFCLGLIAPFIFFIPVLALLSALKVPFLSGIFLVFGIFIHFLFRRFLTQKGLLKKKRPLIIEVIWFILAFLNWLIYFYLILFANNPFQIYAMKDKSYLAAKNSIVNGIKECVVNQAENKPTTFKDVRTFSDGYSTLLSFDIEPVDPDTCFKVKAIPKYSDNTWFEIDLNNETGEVFKTCGDPTKPGCEEGNTW